LLRVSDDGETAKATEEEMEQTEEVVEGEIRMRSR
jgi:hypothetical protein